MEINDIKTYDDFKAFYTNKNVTGYIWMVSDKHPKVYNEESINFNALYKESIPYNRIQEAYLYDGTNSIHIKNIDGKEFYFIHNEAYFIKDKELYSLDAELLELPSHISNISKLYFKQVNKLTPSISGDNFKTWQPIIRLFKGFSNTTPKTTNYGKDINTL